MTQVIYYGVLTLVNVAAITFMRITLIARRGKTGDWVLFGFQQAALIVSSALFGKELYIFFN